MSEENINLTAPIHAATKKGKAVAAREVFMDGDKETVQQIGDKTHQLEDAFKDISVSGGASTANAVSYNNEDSGMTAVTAQGAIDELVTKNKSQDAIIAAKAEKSDVQTSVSELKAKNTSQDAEIAKKANSADVTSQMQTEQSRVNTELGKKFDKKSILQESGNAKDKVMSQKAVSDILGTFSCNSYCYFSGPAYPKVSVINDGNKISITFPSNCELRLYSNKGTTLLANITDGETYEIPTPNKLVYDLSDNSFKIVSYINNLTQLLLIGTSGIPSSKDRQAFAVGLLAHYVNPHLIKIYNGSITTENLSDKVITPTKLADGSFQNDFIVIDKTDKFMSSDCVFGTIQGSGGIDTSNSAFTTPYARVLAGTKVIISAPKITDTNGNTYTPKFRVMLYLQKNDGFLTKLDYNNWSSKTEYIIPNGVNNIRVSALYFKDADGTSNSDIREFCNNAYISIDRDLNNVIDTNNFTPALFDKNRQSLARVEVENFISQESGKSEDKVMSQKAVSDNLSALTNVIKTLSVNSYCYFSGPAYPKVSVINDGNKISITFPSHCEFRLYSNKGTTLLANITDGETYEIPTPNKLVYNIETKNIEIVPAIYDLKHLLLIGACGIPFGSTSVFAVGLLAHYVNPYLSYLKDIKDDIASLKNNVAIFDNVPNFYSRLISYRNNVNKGSNFSFIFFTDIHGLKKEAQRLFSLANTYGSSYIDAIINAGDTVASTINEELDWYNNIVKESSIPTLTAAGNHDCWLNYSPQTFAEPTQTYNKIISTVTEQANVVLPDNAAINGYNYYYKDFGNIRVIVLDSTYAYHSSSYREVEIKWFKEVALADTSKNVLCVIHHPFTDTKNAKNGIITWYEDSNFNTKVPFGDGSVANVDFSNAIDEFIGNGGTFIAWLCGHTHSDGIGIMKEHNNQLVIVNNTARGQNAFPFNVDTDRSDNTDNFDCFDYIGIDTTNGIIKRLRYGVISDIFMRKKEMMCYDYKNHKFIN